MDSSKDSGRTLFDCVLTAREMDEKESETKDGGKVGFCPP